MKQDKTKQKEKLKGKFTTENKRISDQTKVQQSRKHFFFLFMVVGQLSMLD